MHFEVGVEGGEVEGEVVAAGFENPVDHAFEFFVGIVAGGDDEVGEFDPDVGFVVEIRYSVEDVGEVGESEFVVEGFGEGFEVYVGGVDVGVDFVACFFCDVSGGDHDATDVAFVSGFGDVYDPFAPDGGVVVGVGDGWAVVFYGEVDDVIGSDGSGSGFGELGFRDVPVLAEATAEVASSSAEAQNGSAGQEVAEGFFFDGIHGESG